MISDKLKAWWHVQDDINRHAIIAKKQRELHAAHKRMVKASEAEMRCTVPRSGPRGGKLTTLQARTMRATESYLNLLEEFKFFVAGL